MTQEIEDSGTGTSREDDCQDCTKYIKESEEKVKDTTALVTGLAGALELYGFVRTSPTAPGFTMGEHHIDIGQVTFIPGSGDVGGRKARTIHTADLGRGLVAKGSLTPAGHSQVMIVDADSAFVDAVLTLRGKEGIRLIGPDGAELQVTPSGS